MRILWRTLPSLALPAALGLGVAYLATGFVPPPAPNLRPPEELRAVGQAYAEESPVRAILERNVLNLDAPVFAPLDQLSAMDVAPAPAAAAPQGQPAQAAFAPLEATLSPAAATNSSTTLGAPAVPAVSEALSGGHTVVGRIAPPVAAPGPGGTSSAPAQAVAAAPQQTPTTPQPLSAAATGTTPAQTAHAPAPRHAAPAAPAPAAPAAPAPAPSLAGMRLVGVIAGGDRPLAMLSVDGQALSLKVGDTVRGWTLSAVEPGQVVLRSGEHVRRLRLGQTPGSQTGSQGGSQTGSQTGGAGQGQRVVAP